LPDSLFGYPPEESANVRTFPNPVITRFGLVQVSGTKKKFKDRKTVVDPLQQQQQADDD